MPVIVGREDSGENNLPPFLLVLTSCVLWECALSGSIHSCVCAALILGFIRVRGIDERMMFIIDRAGSSGVNKGSLEEVTKEFLSRRGGEFSVLC